MIIVDWKSIVNFNADPTLPGSRFNHMEEAYFARIRIYYLPLIVEPVALTSRDAVAQHFVALSFLLGVPGETQWLTFNNFDLRPHVCV